jgi:hypothetical protein
MGGACSTDWRGYIYNVFARISTQNAHLENIGRDGIKLLKRILKKLVGEFPTEYVVFVARSRDRC